MQPDPALPGRVHSGSERTIACAPTKCLSGVVNQTLPIGMIYRFKRSHFPWRGLRFYLCTCRFSGTAPILRHAEVWYGCRLSGRKRKSLGHCQTVAIDPTETLVRGYVPRLRLGHGGSSLPQLPRGGS